MKIRSIHWNGRASGSAGKGRRRLKKLERTGIGLRTSKMVVAERRRRAKEYSWFL